MTSSTTTQARGRLPVARRDRRPMLAALAILLILLGALGSALIAFRTGDRVQALAIRENVEFGHVMTEADFKEVPVANDTEGVVPASALSQYLGVEAKGNLPSSTLINPAMFAPRGQDVLPEGSAEVGITLERNTRTAEVPEEGEVVMIINVTGNGGQVANGAGTSFFTNDDDEPVGARVTKVESADGDTVTINVLVPAENAPVIANRASTGNIGIAAMPDAAQPVIDIVVETSGEGE